MINLKTLTGLPRKQNNKKGVKYYTLDKINATGALYRIAIGKRSNGKTYAGLRYTIEQYIKTGAQCAYIRRRKEDILTREMMSLYDNLVANNVIQELTEGKYNAVIYDTRRFYLAFKDENGEITAKDATPCCFVFAINVSEHSKSTSYPHVKYIIFDEMLSRTGYIPDEFVLFTNLLSTIIRGRGDVIIYMFGNTVSKYSCPYFAEMGLKHIKDMKPDSIDVYTYGDTGLTVAVEFTDPNTGSPESNKYFAFDNERLKMITGAAAWEIAVYPKCPTHYRPCDVLFTYFIEHDGERVQCDIINTEAGDVFTFIHPKTTEYQKGNNLIYTREYSANPWRRRSFVNGAGDIDRKINAFYASGRVFYSDNDTGEFVRAFIMDCTNKSTLF